MSEANFMEHTNAAPNTDAKLNTKLTNNLDCSIQGNKGNTTKVVVPCRKTPQWEHQKEVPLTSKEAFIAMAIGKAPIGIVPSGSLIPNKKEQLKILQNLTKIGSAKYDNTDSEQQVESWGKPWVESKTLKDHLSMKVNQTVLNLSNPIVFRTKDYLEKLGFKVGFLTDPFTGLDYHAGVFRFINVSKNRSVLHMDDFIRDGNMKPDFRLPLPLKNRPYFQVSFNVLLGDGGHQAAPLYTYNRFYNPCDEVHCMDNGWQFPTELMRNTPVHKYQPQVGETYVFSTTAYHDIYGGSPLSNRVTWSVFAIYVPSLDLMLLYN